MNDVILGYVKLNAPAPGYVFWCRAHHRIATHMQESNLHLCCDPTLSGIAMPCDVCITSNLNATRMYVKRKRVLI